MGNDVIARASKALREALRHVPEARRTHKRFIDVGETAGSTYALVDAEWWTDANEVADDLDALLQSPAAREAQSSGSVSTVSDGRNRADSPSPLSGAEGRPEWQPQTPEQKATNRRLTRLFNGGCDVCVVSQHCERAGRCLAECSPDDLSPPDALGPAEEPKQ
jgi:hypothetical protein